MDVEALPYPVWGGTVPMARPITPGGRVVNQADGEESGLDSVRPALLFDVRGSLLPTLGMMAFNWYAGHSAECGACLLEM